MIQTSIDLKGAYVLVTDDVPANIDVLRQALETDDYQVMGAASGAEALEVAAYQQPDLILLDVMMPGLDGFETCQRFKEDETLRQIPIIFITARGDTEDIVRGLAAGGVDYIVKPFQQEEVLMRVRTHLERYRLMQAQAQHAAQLQQSYDELAQAHRDLEREIRQRQALASKLEKVSERETERWGVEGFVSQSPLLQGILQNIKMLERADSTWGTGSHPSASGWRRRRWPMGFCPILFRATSISAMWAPSPSTTWPGPFRSSLPLACRRRRSSRG